MRKEKGITLVSLVVTIIILIILAGVSINLTLGENGIITITKQAKENTELAKIEEEIALNELYMQIEAEGGEGSNIYIEKLAEFKKEIADYIEEAGGTKPEYTADATTFGESIKGIVKEVTKDATAIADNITEGKTAYVNGELIIGTGVDNNTYYNKGMEYAQNVLYNGQKNYISHTWSSGQTSGSLSNETNYNEQLANYSGTSENIPLTDNNSLLMTISVPVNYFADNSYGSSSGKISLYDANGNLLDSVSGSNNAKFAMAEYDISTSYVYLTFSTSLYVRETNANSTKSTVKFSISDISCLYKSHE